MIAVRRRGYRGEAKGMAWPGGPTGSPGTVKAVMGPREFQAHVATEGFNYDFHPGIDVDSTTGSPLYSPLCGSVVRRHYTHFGWQDAAHLDEFALVAPSSSLSAAIVGSVLRLSCARVGAVSFPSAVDAYRAKTERVAPEGGDWVIEVQLSSAPSLAAGAVGIGLFNAAMTEYVALEYDGATFTRRGVGTATFTANGATTSASGKTWLRVQYTKTSGTFDWLHSTDGSTWTSLGTEAARHFTADVVPSMIPALYWRSGDTNASPFTIDVAQFNWCDEFLNVGRFGNWVEVADATRKIVLAHFSVLSVAQGAFVHAGTLLGKAGTTGFDAISGRITSEHGHLEYHPNNTFEYSRAEGVNPLKAGFLPRANVSNNVGVVRSSANDPDGVDSHLLTITVTRADQDFDLNSITLVGNTASRTINFDSRAGLNSNVDIPKQSGVYIVPSAFNENSSAYVLAVYFNKSVVGSTFTSYSVADSAGTVLASG